MNSMVNSFKTGCACTAKGALWLTEEAASVAKDVVGATGVIATAVLGTDAYFHLKGGYPEAFAKLNGCGKVLPVTVSAISMLNPSASCDGLSEFEVEGLQEFGSTAIFLTPAIALTTFVAWRTLNRIQKAAHSLRS